MIFGVEQRDRERADVFERGFDVRLVLDGDDQREL